MAPPAANDDNERPLLYSRGSVLIRRRPDVAPNHSRQAASTRLRLPAPNRDREGAAVFNARASVAGRLAPAWKDAR